MQGDANGRETDREDGRPCRDWFWLLFGLEAKPHQLPVPHVGGPGVLAPCVHVVCMLPRAGSGTCRVSEQPGNIFLARACVDAGGAHRRRDAVRLSGGQELRRRGACLCGGPRHWCGLRPGPLLVGRDARGGRRWHAYRDRGVCPAHQGALGARLYGRRWLYRPFAHHNPGACGARRACGARGAQRPSRDKAPHHAPHKFESFQAVARRTCGLCLYLRRHGGQHGRRRPDSGDARLQHGSRRVLACYLHHFACGSFALQVGRAPLYRWPRAHADACHPVFAAHSFGRQCQGPLAQAH